MPVKVSHREIVVPGQLVAEGEDVSLTLSPSIYKVNSKVYSSVVGLAEVQEGKVGVIPLEGKYFPKVGDLVIGMVEDVGLTTWILDIRSPYRAVLHANEYLNRPFNPLKDNLRNILEVGDYVIAKILSFDRSRDPTLTTKGRGLGKISSGRVVDIVPSRVPRVIGKKGSMISMLKKETGCDIVVGLNGRIWVKSRDSSREEVAILAIKKIELETHTSGLTDRVREFIVKELEERGVGRNG